VHPGRESGAGVMYIQLALEIRLGTHRKGGPAFGEQEGVAVQPVAYQLVPCTPERIYAMVHLAGAVLQGDCNFIEWGIRHSWFTRKIQIGARLWPCWVAEFPVH